MVISHTYVSLPEGTYIYIGLFSQPRWVVFFPQAALNIFIGHHLTHDQGLKYQPWWEYNGSIVAIYPLVNVYIAMEKHHFSWENQV